MGGLIKDVPVAGELAFPTQEERTVESTPAKEQRELNDIILNQIRGLINRGSDLKTLSEPSDAFTLSEDAQGLADKIIAFAETPGLSTESFLENVFGASSSVLSDIIAPQIQNQLSAAGLGKSGAVGEAVGRAATELSLPIAMNLPGIDTALRAAQLNRLGVGLQTADIPRTLQVADLLRRTGIALPAFTGLPFSAGGTNVASVRKDLVGGVLIPAAAGALGGGGGGGGTALGNAGNQPFVSSGGGGFGAGGNTAFAGGNAGSFFGPPASGGGAPVGGGRGAGSRLFAF